MRRIDFFGSAIAAATCVATVAFAASPLARQATPATASDSGAGARQNFYNASRIAREVQRRCVHAHDARPPLPVGTGNHAVEAVLARHCVHGRTRSRRDGGNPPGRVSAVPDGILGVHRLMCSMERTEADMHNAGRQAVGDGRGHP